VYTTQREGTTARKAMPLEAYVVDWLKPSNPPTASSRNYNSQGCRSCQQTANAPDLNKPSNMADWVGGGGR